jgi:hypothetical protein
MKAREAGGGEDVRRVGGGEGEVAVKAFALPHSWANLQAHDTRRKSYGTAALLSITSADLLDQSQPTAPIYCRAWTRRASQSSHTPGSRTCGGMRWRA